MFKSLGDDRGELRALLKEQDEKYAQMKALKDTKIFNKGNDLLSDDFNFDKVGDLINKNNDIWAKTTKGLNKEQIAEVEKAYIRSAIKDELVDLGMNRKGFNPIAVAEKLSNAKFVSDEAKTLQKALFDDAKFRPNTKGIIDAIDAGLKTQKAGGSMATSVVGKATVAFVAKSFRRLAKHIPIIGKQAGKENLYAEAFLKAKTTPEALTNIMKNETIPIKDRFDLLTQVQSKEIRALIDDFMLKKEQAKKDLIKMDATARNQDTGIIQTFIQPGSKSNSELGLPNEIIPKQAQEEFKKLLNEYDVDKFLSDRENILAKNAKYGRNRIADRNIESNDGVGGWEYKLTPAGYEKNYKADFLTTKADVAKIRAGKMDETTFNKLKSDLESSNALGYEYKKASDYADMEDFEREFGSLSNPKGGRTINASPHIASGLLGGTANGADENGNVSPEEFAKGFIYALFGSKITAEGVKRVSPELYNKILSISKKPSKEIKKIVDDAGVDKLAKQEKRGIYNVTYNGKKATWLKQDVANIDNAIRYESGNLSKGAKHISIRHLDDENKVGFVTKEELLNLGKNVRKFIKEHKEPFINDRKARLYEWEDDKGVRFRLVVGNETAGTPYTDELPQPAVSNDIITFYSDRNLKEPMEFENPKLKLLDAIDNSSDKVGAVEKILLNKHISDGVKAKAVNRLTRNKFAQVSKGTYISTKNSHNN